MMAQPVLAFFSMPDTVLILVIALLLFGPKNLPKMARGIGKSMEEFRRAAREIETEIMKEPEPTTPPPPPPPTTDVATTTPTEQTPESEHPYGETGEEYHGYESETGTETTPSAPVVVSDVPVTLPADAVPAAAAVAPVVAVPATVPEAAPAVAATAVPSAPTPAPVAVVPAAAPAAAPAVAAAPVTPPVEKKSDAQTAA